MADSRRINRKTFIELTVCAGAGMWFTACGSGDVPDAPTGGTGAGAAGGAGGVGGTGGGAGAAPKGGAGAGGSSAGTGAGTGGVSASGGTTGGAGGVGRGGAGAGGTAGTVSAGNGGTAGNVGGAGSPGAGAGGLGMAGRGAGGAAAGGAAAGGAGSGAGGSSGGMMCVKLTITQNSGGERGHDHIPNDMPTADEYRQTLMDFINGPTATTEAFKVFAEGMPLHQHDVLFTQSEIDTLRAGGKLTAKAIVPDTTKEEHVYTIGCTP